MHTLAHKNTHAYTHAHLPARAPTRTIDLSGQLATCQTKLENTNLKVQSIYKTPPPLPWRLASSKFLPQWNTPETKIQNILTRSLTSSYHLNFQS